MHAYGLKILTTPLEIQKPRRRLPEIIFRIFGLQTNLMKYILLSFALSATFFAFGQKVKSALTFTKGQTLEVVTNMNIAAESMMGPLSGTATVKDNYTVSDASANAFTLQKLPKQVKMDFTMGSQQMKVDSDKPDEMSGLLAQPVKDIMSHKPEFTIDATGKITAVKGTGTKEGDGKENAMMGMMLPGMDMSAALPQAGNPSLFQVLPNREVGVGDTWTDSVAAEGSTNKNVYKITGITDKEITLDFTGEGTTKTAKEAMGMKVDVDAANKATGSIVLDKATGVLKQKTVTNTTETHMNMGGQEMNTTVKTTVVTTVQPVAGSSQ